MDAQTVEALYRSYAPLVRARARRIVGTEADDVVQEVFLRLLKQRPDVREMTAWMYTTASNVALDRLRFLSRRDARWQASLAEHAQAAPPRSVDEVLASQELVRRVLVHTDRRTQEVVVLVIFDEMTQEQAAELLGISRKTVNERLKRFRAQAEKQVRRWSS